jgi:hypothetical protein
MSALSGERFAEMCLFQLGNPGGERAFVAIARREGKRMLRTHHGATLREHYGAKEDTARIDAALDEILGWVLDITSRVVADERALAH